MSRPAVSLVIPTRDRVESLGRCLAAIGRLREPSGGFEVIVATDGPCPQSATLAAAVGAGLVEGPGNGPASARNAGAAAAAAPLLAFTDDDCEPTPGWLLAICAAQSAGPTAGPAAGVGGRTLNGARGNLSSEASQATVDAFVAWSNGGPGGPQFYPSNNLALPTEGFGAIGGFDPTYPGAAGEDRDLCRRWIESGRELIDAPQAVIRHMRSMSIDGLWRQQRGYGRGARHFLATNPEQGRALADAGFTLALRRRLAADRDPRRARLAGRLALAQIATAWGYRSAG